MNFCLTLIGTLFVPMFALGENLVDCSAVLQTGVQKKTVNNITGWSAISKQEILVNNSNALFLSKEIAETNSFMLLASVLKNNTDKKIKPHPGLGGITGYQGLLASFPESPVTSGNAAKAEQKLETFKGKIKTLGRSLASLDGKLGNMAVQEWQMVSDSVQAIKPTAGNLDEQMRDVVRQARLLAKNLRDKFDLTYEDTTPAAAPGRPAAAALAPADKQALDWANANPKDPRSLQIKQRLGQ